jgi:hypothetical protein
MTSWEPPYGGFPRPQLKRRMVCHAPSQHIIVVKGEFRIAIGVAGDALLGNMGAGIAIGAGLGAASVERHA